ncbi:helix-turn-helix domain-containing protein [Desulfovibrio falkowii]|uniref:helix-turn-helix domain-containing protein n=1 Tax=Desulfovibrio sp. WGS1351 TaxID=3366814 RepID=UPI00372D8406
MFKSNIRDLMDKKGKTIRDISNETNVSLGTVHRSTKDETIGSCQLSTLARIGAALGVKTKRLYDEKEEQEKN